MRKDLNANLLRKIKCWESGEVLSKVVFFFLLLGIILYFTVGKVYIPISYIIKEKSMRLKRKKSGKRSKKRRGKVLFWITLIILGSMISGRKYTGYYVKAAETIKGSTQEAELVEESEERSAESEMNPRLNIYSQGWKKGKGDFSDYLFNKEDTSVVLQLEDSLFHKHSEEEQFLFQVSEGSEDFTKIKNYQKDDFNQSDEEAIYQKVLDFRTENGKEQVYNIHLKYWNKRGLPLIDVSEQENKYGEIVAGEFKSRSMVIDRKCPEIESIYIKRSDDIGNTVKQIYYNGSVKGVINIKETYLDWDLVHIWAVPLDETAQKLAQQKEEENNQGAIDILGWKHTRKKDSIQISFDFFMEGRWKICCSCEDLAGNKGVCFRTGREIAESEEFIIDNTAPELSVRYAGISNIMKEPFSTTNVNKKIQNNKGKITSSQNQIFVGKESEVTIQIKETNIDKEAIEIKLYRIIYGTQRELEQTESEVNTESEGTFIYSIKNLKEGHYKIVIHCKDKAGNKMTALKDNETNNCINDGEYESPLYTVDTVSPVIAEVFCNQNPIRKIGERQYFQNAPKIIIRIKEENFNRSNFTLNGQLFYASGKVMKQEWERIKEQADNLQWKSYYKDEVRVNETSMDIDIEGNYLMYFQCVDGAAHIGNQKELAMTYDCTKPEIVYTGGNYLNEDLIFNPETEANSQLKSGSKPKAKLEPKLGLMNEKGIEMGLEINENPQTNFLAFRRYSFFRYFSKKRIYASIRVKDEISGVEKINYKFIPYRDTEESEKEWITVQNAKLKDSMIQAQAQTQINPQAQISTQTEIKNQDLSEMIVIALPEQKNFKGYLKIYGQDYSGNAGKVVNSKGIVSEDEKLHEDVSKISIKMPKPVFTDKEKNIRYYNKSVPVSATFEDRQSGILKAILCGKMINLSESLSGGKDVINSMNLNKTAEILEENAVVWDAENMVQRKDQRIILEAQKFQQSDADNPVIIQGKMTDNAGHMSEERFDKKLVIDTIKPEIKVEYDNSNKTGYYNMPRKAIVTIKERNFNPDFVEWKIKGSNQNYRIGEWRTIDNKSVNKQPEKVENKGINREINEKSDKETVEDIHYCDIYFEEDGEDYAINLSVSDYAGNKAEWKDREYFTVDRTIPEISIKIDSEDKIDDKDQIDGKKDGFAKTDNQTEEIKYFNTAKEVVFCIQDKNFDKDKVEYNIKAIKGGKKVRVDSPKNYIKEGERYYSRLSLKKEAQYYIQVKCKDKAGNESEKKEITPVIDTTAPEITVQGVENDTTYDGKVVMPEVICSDEYLDLNSVKVHLVRANGKIVSKKEWNYEYIEKEEGEGNKKSKENDKKSAKIKVQFCWDNLPEKKTNDGIYQLQIRAEDKAGNRTGSKAGNNYVKKEEDAENKGRKETQDVFEITFRVNRWGAHFILDNDLKNNINGHYLKAAPEFRIKEQCVKQTKSNVIILKDNEERRTIGKEDVKERIIADKGLEKYGWHEKDYIIRKNNFVEEGDYRVTVQADSKKKEIHFVVDKTPPVISINGLESDIYEEKEHEFTISIMDNYAFEKMELYIGKEIHSRKSHRIIIRPEDLDENHMFRQKIKESGQKQTIYYVAWDKAGNRVDSDENGDTKSCFVTSNKVFKEYYKHKGRYMRIAVTGVMILAGLFAGGYISIKYIARCKEKSK